MSIEESFQKQKSKDLTNEDIRRAILVDGDEKELEELRLFLNITSEQIKLFSYFAKMRKSIREEMEGEVNKRKLNNPIATQDELNMGTYIESIEPQVRQAVINLRKKGYNTYESGFYGTNKQEIGFKEGGLKDFSFPNELINELKSREVDIETKSDSIILTLNKPFNIVEIKEIWDKVELYSPDLKKEAEQCGLRSSVVFREKQGALKNK